MIVTNYQRSRPTPKATPIGTRQGHAGSAYQVGKRLAEYSGYAKEIKPYLPETYLDKYTYKPRKRLAGYAGQKLWSKKNGSYYKQYKKRCQQRQWDGFNYTEVPFC